MCLGGSATQLIGAGNEAETERTYWQLHGVEAKAVEPDLPALGRPDHTIPQVTFSSRAVPLFFESCRNVLALVVSEGPCGFGVKEVRCGGNDNGSGKGLRNVDPKRDVADEVRRAYCLPSGCPPPFLEKVVKAQ